MVSLLSFYSCLVSLRKDGRGTTSRSSLCLEALVGRIKVHRCSLALKPPFLSLTSLALIQISRSHELYPDAIFLVITSKPFV